MKEAKRKLKPEFEPWLKESRIFNYMIGMMGPGTGAGLQMLLGRVGQYEQYFPMGSRSYAVKVAYMMIMLDLSNEISALKSDVQNLEKQIADLRQQWVKPD